MKGFRELIVWQKAYKFALDVYQLTKSFPREELYGIVSQVRRSVCSVSVNIAEGYARKSRKEYLQFLYVSRGSLSEVENFLMFSRDLGYMTNNRYHQIEGKRQEVGKLLHGLIKSLSA